MHFRQLRGWLMRLFGLFQRGRREREFAAELESHLAQHIADNLRAGMSPEEARRQARIKLGGVTQTQELHREQRGLPMLETLVQDLRFGLRMLRKNPGFSLIAILTLALGIGANTAIFSVVNAVLLRPLPYEESERLMFLSERTQQMDVVSISWPNYQDWRARNTVFEQFGVYNRGSYNLTESGAPERLLTGQVTADLFAALRVKPTLGRVFTHEEDKPGAELTVVLGHALWQRRFGGDPNIVNKTIKLNELNYTVVGVMPAGFQYPSSVELWVSVGRLTGSEVWQGRGNHMGLYGIARLKPGATVEQARAEMENISASLAKEYPASNQDHWAAVTPLKETIVGDVGQALWILLGAVGVVLLIACANVANLLLARAATRQREIAVRLAVGASRWRVVRQLLTESVLLALLGGGLGIILAVSGVELILTIGSGSLPRADEIRLDRGVLTYTAAISLLTGIAFGLIPALQTSRARLHETLKESGRSLATGRHWARGALVVTQTALTLTLLVGAGLLVRSFYRLQQVNPGFAVDRLLSFRLPLPGRKYPGLEQRVNFYRQLTANLQSLPGVEAAAVSSGLPLGNTDWQSQAVIVGRPLPPPHERLAVETLLAGPEYFRAMGIPLVAGRWFDERDNRAHLNQSSANAGLTAGVSAVIIDEDFARRHFPGGNAVGQRLRMFGAAEDPQTPALVIVGVVGRVKADGLRAETNRPQVYAPIYQLPLVDIFVIVKTKGDPAQLIAAAQQQVTRLDAEQPIYSIRTMEKIRSDSLASERLNLTLLGLFAALALALALVGIYGVMSCAVTQRTHEIGIRLALGAQTRDVLRMIVRQGMTLSLAGVGIGLLLSLALTRLLETLLFDVSATDPLTFIVIALLLMVVALVACWIPARRATKVDPMIALRTE